MSRIQPRAWQAAAMLIVALPLFAFFHEALLVVTAALLHALFQTRTLEEAAGRVVTDPVHARILLEVSGGIRPLGLAVTGAPGQFLQQLFPLLFLESKQVAPGAWVSAVFSPDSTIFSLILTRALVECSLIALGGLLVQWGMPHLDFASWLRSGSARRLAAVAGGFMILGQAIWGLFGPTLVPAGATLRDAGIGFALSTVWQVSASQYAWLMDQVLPQLVPSLFTATGLMLAWLVSRLLYRFARDDRLKAVAPMERRRVITNGVILLSILVLAVAFSAFWGSYGGLASSSLADVEQPPSSPVPSVPSTIALAQAQPTNSATAISPAVPAPPGLATPTVLPSQPVQFPLLPTETPPASMPCTVPSGWPIRTGVPYTTAIQPTLGLRILVNGQATSLIGMNYNVNYTLLPLETRRARHRRDFQLLRAFGVNAIIGWGVYDEATLQVAQEYGIDVIMPFDLDPQGAYDNANYREDIKSKFRIYVNRFRAFPAVLAWNPGGDELLHRMEVDQHRTKDKLQAAADFLLELSQLAYALDPNHVSIVKDARDWYVPYFEQSIQKMRAQANQPDPARYFVYGVNVYGTPANIAAALANAKQYLQYHLHVAMLVGEYAPFGLARKDRPTDYGLIWDIVLTHSPNGGFAYVFGPDQPNPQSPNPYDPLRLLVNEFSLVDINGTPVDDSLAVLSAQWLCRTLMPPHLP